AAIMLVIWLYYMDRVSTVAEVFKSTGQGILVTDSSGTIEMINPAFTRLTGYTEEEVIGRNPNILSSGRQSKEFYTTMWGQIGQEGSWHGKVWNKKKDGEEYLELLSINTVTDNAGEVLRYVGTFSDITP